MTAKGPVKSLRTPAKPKEEEPKEVAPPAVEPKVSSFGRPIVAPSKMASPAQPQGLCLCVSFVLCA